ncbi:MAG: hypothetical protein ACRD34_13035, partial [Bryobacteraceae bacterium]
SSDLTDPGDVIVRSPAMHDVEKAIHVHAAADDPVELLPRSFVQSLVAQDTLIVELNPDAAPAAADKNVVAIGIYYSDLPGASARLHLPGDIAGNIKYVRHVRVDVTGNATPGDWSSATVESTEDIWHANKDYAILGYYVVGEFAAVALHGDATSNYKVGGPGSTAYVDTRDYFWQTSIDRQTPHIPVINAADKGSTYVDVVSKGASGTGSIYLVMAELVANLSS